MSCTLAAICTKSYFLQVEVGPADRCHHSLSHQASGSWWLFGTRWAHLSICFHSCRCPLATDSHFFNDMPKLRDTFTGSLHNPDLTVLSPAFNHVNSSLPD